MRRPRLSTDRPDEHAELILIPGCKKTLDRYQLDEKVSDRCLIYIDLRVFDN